jgi:hypothetical protein
MRFYTTRLIFTPPAALTQRPCCLLPATVCSFSPLCTDVPTLKGGVAEGKRAVMRLAQALLRDSLDQGPPRDEVHESNIMPLTAELSAAAGGTKARAGGGLSRLWRR